MRPAILPAVLALLPLLAVRADAAPVPNFEGTWSVLIVTEAGECDRAYRYPVKIKNGAVQYLGAGDFSFSGFVERSGRVKVSISRGDRSATGTGVLSDNEGSGTWSGRAASVSCHGRWEAERRSN